MTKSNLEVKEDLPEVVTSKQSLKEKQGLTMLRRCIYAFVLLGGRACNGNREGKSERDKE